MIWHVLIFLFGFALGLWLGHRRGWDDGVQDARRLWLNDYFTLEPKRKPGEGRP